MHRFFVPAEILALTEAALPPEISRQTAAVLRLREGEHIVLLDNLGSEFEAELTQVNPKGCHFRIINRHAASGEPPVSVTLYLALTQREKFEWALQKCTEVGVTGFVPLITSRSLVQDVPESAAKHDRWRKIIQEAAEQCGRGRLPDLLPPMDLPGAFKHAAAHHSTILFAWEKETAICIDQVLTQGSATAIFIGPEGGFSDNEARLAAQNNAIPVSLGKRILRMETAAVVAAAIVLHYMEK